MSHEMSPHLALGVFPSAQRLGRGGNARVDAEIVQKPLRVETEQVLAVEFLGVLEGAVEQADLRQVERLGPQGDLGRHPSVGRKGEGRDECEDNKTDGNNALAVHGGSNSASMDENMSLAGGGGRVNCPMILRFSRQISGGALDKPNGTDQDHGRRTESNWGRWGGLPAFPFSSSKIRRTVACHDGAVWRQSRGWVQCGQSPRPGAQDAPEEGVKPTQTAGLTSLKFDFEIRGA